MKAHLYILCCICLVTDLCESKHYEECPRVSLLFTVLTNYSYNPLYLQFLILSSLCTELKMLTFKKLIDIIIYKVEKSRGWDDFLEWYLFTKHYLGTYYILILLYFDFSSFFIFFLPGSCCLGALVITRDEF